MPDISPVMIAEGLKRFGYAPTPENVQRAGEMLVSNPGMLDKLMGLQGGAGGESGANPSIMMSQLDKLAGTSSSGQSNGMTVGNGNPNQPPLPQAPLPENIPSAGNSPTSIAGATPATAKAPVATIPSTLSNSAPASTGMPSPAVDAALNKVVSDTSAAPTSVPANDGASVGEQPISTQSPTSMEEYALAVGIPLATAATGYAAYQALQNTRPPGSREMTVDDLMKINEAANGPRTANAADIGVADPTAKPKSNVEMTLDDLVDKTAPRNMQEKDLYPGQTPSDIEKLKAEVATENAALESSKKAPNTNTDAIARKEGRTALNSVAAERPIDKKGGRYIGRNAQGEPIFDRMDSYVAIDKSGNEYPGYAHEPRTKPVTGSTKRPPLRVPK